MKRHDRQTTAFTLIELLVVIAVLALLAATMLPALAVSKRSVQKVSCVNNLKQVGIAFRVWEGNHGGHYPMAVSYASGGANEYLSHSTGNNNSANSGSQPSTGFGQPAYLPQMAFMVMSNELATTKIVYCPADNFHTPATNFTYQNFVGGNIYPPGAGPITTSQTFLSGCSYFVGADATEADPQSIISGDCNIGNTGTTGNTPASWRIGATSSFAYSSPSYANFAQAITSIAFSSVAAGEWGWTANDLHQKTGNLLIGDGSVQSATVAGLKQYLNGATNSVVGPVVNFVW